MKSEVDDARALAKRILSGQEKNPVGDRLEFRSAETTTLEDKVDPMPFGGNVFFLRIDKSKSRKKKAPKKQLQQPGVEKKRLGGEALDEEHYPEGRVADLETGGLIRRSAAGGAGPEGEVPDIVHDVLRSSGQPLDRGTREFMEERLNHDFSAVRVHTDDRAAESARAVNARAYTVGSQIVFSRGRYRPTSTQGTGLLAHELVHVVQQSGAALSSGLRLGSPTSSQEIEAESISARVGMSRRQVVGTWAGIDTPSINGRHPDFSTAFTSPVVMQRLSSLGIQREIEKKCSALSYFTDGLVASGFGLIAEKYTEKDYESKMGCTSKVDSYFDSLESGHFNYLSFLKAHNKITVDLEREDKKEMPRPDILLHTRKFEFEELKPNSSSGKSKGLEKIELIDQFMRAKALPYKFGVSYKPNPNIPIASTSAGGVPFEISLRLTRDRPGLLLYDICIKTDWTKAVDLALAAILAAILALLLRGKSLPAPQRLAPVPAIAFRGGETNTASKSARQTVMSPLPYSSEDTGLSMEG
ncbi:DUF4157 domain-containing protein (plasmid) [Rhizobium leguminosarum bv. trifolii]|nr:DUF4157 domain-containing protein [Rhizobium leguminosarum bv. trifolii]